MDLLSAFGLSAVIAMLTFYVLEERSVWFVLAFMSPGELPRGRFRVMFKPLEGSTWDIPANKPIPR